MTTESADTSDQNTGDDAAPSTSPSSPPNVRPGAVSGLDHKPLDGSGSSSEDPEVGTVIPVSDEQPAAEKVDPEEKADNPVEEPQPVDGDGKPIPTPDSSNEGTGGTPLDPPQTGADPDGFGGDAPAPADGQGDGGSGDQPPGA